ncbi:MAG: hypothetical protein WC829_08255 [Hyphomicrobium sp.]|jgi:hypothetical protein
MSDDLPSLQGGNPGRKKGIVLKLLLAIFAGLFFLLHLEVAPSSLAEAPSPEEQRERYQPLDFGEFDPMRLVKKHLEAAVAEKELKAKKKQAEKIFISSLSEKYYNLVVGHPIEEMLPYIAKCDSETAIFLIAIAKKESDWGEHSPKKEGKNCYNYWGYRGTYNQTDSGYSCFDSPEQAIEVVGRRIGELLAKNIDTPQKMVVWKCGSSCAGHDPASVRKWISDVALYRDKLNS